MKKLIIQDDGNWRQTVKTILVLYGPNSGLTLEIIRELVKNQPTIIDEIRDKIEKDHAARGKNRDEFIRMTCRIS